MEKRDEILADMKSAKERNRNRRYAQAPAITPDQAREIRQAYREGSTMIELSKEYITSTRTIQKVIKCNGVYGKEEYL